MKKVRKNNTKEENTELDNIKLKKKFKSLKEAALIAEAILLIPVLMIIIVGALIIGEKIFQGTNEILTSVILDEKAENVDLTTDDYINFAEKVSGTQLYFENESNNYKMLVVKSSLIAFFCDYIMMVLIIDNLVKIFGNIEKDEKPFNVKNIKYLNRINVLSCLLWIFGTEKISMSLVPILIISAIIYIYKYGCKIQKEIDETL